MKSTQLYSTVSVHEALRTELSLYFQSTVFCSVLSGLNCTVCSVQYSVPIEFTRAHTAEFTRWSSLQLPRKCKLKYCTLDSTVQYIRVQYKERINGGKCMSQAADVFCWFQLTLAD